jgi:hypothetical protein
MPYDLKTYSPAHTITAYDMELAYLLNDGFAKDRITEYGRVSQDMLKSLIVPFVPDLWEGRAILAGARGGGTPKAITGQYHPRRGNGKLFAKYETMLNNVGLSANNQDGAVQHVIVPAASTPPLQRNYGTPIEVEKKYGIGDVMRTVPITVHPREVPDWTLNDEKVCEFLKHRCPGAFRPPIQRQTKRPTHYTGAGKRYERRAHRKVAELCAVIYLWYRVLLTAEQIAAELGVESGHVIRIANDAREHYPLFVAGECGCFNRGKRHPLAVAAVA